MRYKIYELTQPKVLSEIDTSDYSPREVKKTVLNEVRTTYGFNDEHSTIGDAYDEIERCKESLKHMILTIIPIISVHWDGEIN